MGTAHPVEILVCHASPLVCAGLAATLTAQPDITVVNAVFGASELAPGPVGADVVIADFDSCMELHARLSSSACGHGQAAPRMLIVTGNSGEWDIRHALTLGIPGYLRLGCTAEKMLAAARAVARGGRCYDDAVTARIADSMVHASLTRREYDVLHLMHQGAPNKQIARVLDIQVGTVKAHVKAILEKLQVSTRTQAVVVAEHRGLVRAQAAANSHPLFARA